MDCLYDANYPRRYSTQQHNFFYNEDYLVTNCPNNFELIPSRFK